MQYLCVNNCPLLRKIWAASKRVGLIMRCYRVSQYTFLATGRLHCRQQPNLCYVLQGGPGRSERPPLAGWWAETAKVSNVHVFACPRQITAEVMDLTCSLPLQKLTRCERSKSWVPPNWLSPPLTFEAWAALPPELEPFFQDAATLTVSPQVNSIFSGNFNNSAVQNEFSKNKIWNSWALWVLMQAIDKVLTWR